MRNLIKQDGGRLLVTSNDVADKFGKEHRTIYRKIEELIKNQPVFGADNFGVTTYITDQNKTHKCYSMTRDGFCMIAMSLTGREAEAWKIKYIEAFNTMEGIIQNYSMSIEEIHQITKGMESSEQIASFCGKMLAKFRKIKGKNEKLLTDAKGKCQMNIEFDKEDKDA
ncbi:hypothetical protein VPGG_00005 [Vibrio phage VBM1]|uniref:Rha-like transcriptional regulator n=1 Tax=Vibrio phage VBM1 TaxID=754074 RepID=UPI0002C071A6|nr:Rha-like transcriptional regulator [Vibrio phage VBM1]AGH07322.1 hypothetical protein VPGG_00005 [Vibrio phage VBM1]